MSLAGAMQESETAASLGALRQSTVRWLLRERNRARVATGVPALDGPLGGGWPRGRVGELVGPASTGRTTIATATASAATRSGEVVAWVDAADAFAPDAARAAGVVLERVLWVRPAGLVEAIRVAELVLAGGFPIVVIDLARPWCERAAVARVRRSSGARPGTPGREGEDGRLGALRLRLVRATERAGAVVLVLADRPWAGTLAGVAVELERGTAVWGGEPGTPRWLAGLAVTLRLERGGVGPVGIGIGSRPGREEERDEDRLAPGPPVPASPTCERPALLTGSRPDRIATPPPAVFHLQSPGSPEPALGRAGA